MSDTAKLLFELRAKIAENRRTLEEQERALAVLEKMMGVNGADKAAISTEHIVSPPSGELVAQGNQISLDDIWDEVKPKANTFADDVADAVKRVGDQEFTVAHIEAVMKRLGKVDESMNRPRARISQALSRMEDETLIVRTFTGGGNVPNRYKAARTGTESVSSDAKKVEELL